MEETDIKDQIKKEWKEVVLENEKLRVALLPELGGKMTVLENKLTGTQFLKEYVKQEGELKPPKVGFSFEPPYAYGFDECFPTVAPSNYLFNERVIHWPDHGELWTQEWDYELDENRIVLKTSGVNLLYEFTKEIILRDNQVVINYSVENRSYESFDYLWSSHPLLEIDEGDELLIHEKIKEVSVHESDEEGQVKKRKTGWPYLLGNETDFTVVQSQNSKHAMKLFAEQVEKGSAGLYRKRTDETILFEFDTEKIPHLGIWLCYGGWPEDAETGSYTVALEPATASFDKLSDAIGNGENKVIGPGEYHSWNMTLKILSGKAEI